MLPITAQEYLLRINHRGGLPEAKTPVNSYPGSEAFYVPAGPAGPKDSAPRTFGLTAWGPERGTKTGSD